MRKTFSAWIASLLICLPVAGQPAGVEVKTPLSVSRAVALALENNPSIRQADADIGAAGQSANSARADMLPTAALNYGYTGLREKPVMKTAGGDVQTAHRNLYNWDITVVQPLFAGFALRATFEIAGLDRVVRQLEKEQLMLDLTRDVKRACYHLLLTQKLLSVSDDEVRALGGHKRDAELFFKQGMVPANDLLKARVVLSDTLQRREKRQADVQKAVIRLNRLMGRHLNENVALEDITAVPKGSYDADGLGRRALEERPLMQLLNVGMEKLGLAQKLARSRWYPQVSLVGRYEQDGDNPEATDNDYTNTHNASIGIQAQWNFWQSGKTRAEIARVRRQVESLKARIEAYRQQVIEEVQGVVLDCQVAFRNIDTSLKSLDQAKENWRITELQYKNQMATSTDVLDARTFLTQADGNYLRAVYGFLDATAALDRAVGKKSWIKP